MIIAEERSQRPGLHESRPIEKSEKSPFVYGNEHLTPPEIFAIRDKDSKPNSPGWKVRVVPNKFRALSIEEDAIGRREGFFESFGGYGAHEVIIDTPDPIKTPGKFTIREFTDLFNTMQARYNDLSGDHNISYVQIFKNSGPKAGATIEHAHSQLIALPFIPKNVEDEIETMRAYYSHNDRNLFMDELSGELADRERVVYENGGFVVFCPYASFFPFEMRIAPKFQSADFSTLEKCVVEELAEVTQYALSALEKSVEHVAYNMVLKLPPLPRDHKNPHFFHHMEHFFQWYIEITPRIYNMAGFELGTGQFINPVAPEKCARFLREIAD